jgi:hypothetical protein
MTAFTRLSGHLVDRYRLEECGPRDIGFTLLFQKQHIIAATGSVKAATNGSRASKSSGRKKRSTAGTEPAYSEPTAADALADRYFGPGAGWGRLLEMPEPFLMVRSNFEIPCHVRTLYSGQTGPMATLP